MGRLFWKFFFIFWLAQFITAASVATGVLLDFCSANSDSFAACPVPPFPFSPEFFEGGNQIARGRLGDQSYSYFLPPPLIPIIGGLLVSLVFAALLAWYFSRPIRTLRNAFESVAVGKLETRIGLSMGNRRDELADLGHNFDHMAGRLQSLVETQRRLLHEVSHELRSPLSRMQAVADLMQQQPDRSVEYAARIQRDTARMDTLIGQLLTLSRLDAGITGKLDGEIDLYEMIVEISDNASLEAERKDCSIHVALTSSVFVRGNHELLYRAIENVVRNSVKHSQKGGLVSVSAEPSGKLLKVIVADCGPGVPEEDLVKIFEPFIRSGSATSTSGYGLGLAITRRVTELHGGKVFASNRPTGGLLVILELPLSKH